MAESNGLERPSLEAAIVDASTRISLSGERDDVPLINYGSAFNHWQKPVTEYGRNDPQWEVRLKASHYVDEMDFGRNEWAGACDAVDAVMDLLLNEMRVRSYDILLIDSYIRQGSSRDGLKVIKPDKFDAFIEFRIDGLPILPEPIQKHERMVSGFCHLQVQQFYPPYLQAKYPKLWSEGAFQLDSQNNVLLSQRKLHQVVESIIYQSIQAIRDTVDTMKDSQNVNFYIERKNNSPAINITIHFDDTRGFFIKQGHLRIPSDGVNEIDIDIVPAIRLRIDEDTKLFGSPMNAVIHAVSKWKEEEAMTSLEFVDQNLVWHISSADYERYILDVARTNLKQRYILTALRILKTYFTKTKIVAKQENRPPPPVATVLQSYHLNHLALYLILYACFVHPHIQIDGIERALTCFIAMLHVSLQKRHLPHFFYSNSQIRFMIPNLRIDREALRFDLFRKIQNEYLREAELSIENHLIKDLGFSFGGSDDDRAKVVSSFSQEIDGGEYF